MNEYKFKAIIEGVVYGENYQDAIENIDNPAMIISIDKTKVKKIEVKKDECK